jgi:hypothetical protein
VENVSLTSAGGRAGSAVFHLIDYRDRPLEIKVVESSSPSLKARVKERPRACLPGWRYLLEALFDGAAVPPGHYRETIRPVTDDPERPVITVVATIRRLDRIRVAPSALYLRPGEGSSRPRPARVFIDDVEGMPVQIERVEYDREVLTCSFQRSPADRQVVEFGLCAKPKSGPGFPQVVTIKLKHPVAEEVSLKVHADMRVVLP